MSYIEPGDTTATAITDDDYLGDAVYCARKKIIGVRDDDVRTVLVFDTATGVTTPVPDTDVWDIVPGANLENDDISVDGSYVAILHRGELGKVLKVINESGATPVVTTFDFELTNAVNVDVDATSGNVAVMEDNNFITIFPAAGPADVEPERFDVTTDAGIPIAYTPKLQISGALVLFEELNESNVYALNLSTGVSTKLILNPAASNGTTSLENRAGFFAYYLDRNAGDNDAQQGSRVCIGTAGDLNNIALATGNDLGDGILSGFGHSIAISPDGLATYIAGRFGQSIGGGVNEPSYLQVATTAGFVLLPDSGNDAVLAADVVASDSIVAFKVSQDIGAVLGYYVP